MTAQAIPLPEISELNKTLWIIELYYKEKFNVNEISKLIGIEHTKVKLIIDMEERGMIEAKNLAHKLDMEQREALRKAYRLPSPEEVYDWWMEHGFCPRLQVADHFGLDEMYIKNSIDTYSRSQKRMTPTGGRSLYV